MSSRRDLFTRHERQPVEVTRGPAGAEVTADDGYLPGAARDVAPVMRRSTSLALSEWREEVVAEMGTKIIAFVVIALVSTTPTAAQSIRESAERFVHQSAPTRLSIAETEMTQNGGDVDAPMISQPALFRTVLGAALSAAAVFIPDDWPSERKWAAKTGLTGTGSIITFLFGDTPDHDSMARDRVGLIASCIDIKGADVILDAIDQAAVHRVCPAALRPPTAEAREIAARTVEEVFRRVYEIPEGELASGLLAPFVDRVQSRDHRPFVRELLAAASRLGQ